MQRRRILLLGLVMTLSLVIVPVASAHGGSHGNDASDHGSDKRGQKHVDQTPHGSNGPTARLAAWNEASQQARADAKAAAAKAHAKADKARHDANQAKHHAPAPLPTQIDLPAGFQPEGITSVGKTLYVGSLVDGAIWRGSAKTGKGQVAIPGVAGQSAAGIHVDWRGRLWVAGATDHTIRVYSLRSGSLLATYTFPTAGFLNDLVITRKGVYATDSLNAQLAFVPFSPWGKLPAPEAATTIALTGAMAIADGFNANGIVAKGGMLVTVQSNTGLLFSIDPATGVTTAIDTGGVSLLNGDGLLLHGRTLYVVRNQDNLVAVLTLGKGLASATQVKELTSVGLDVPTTATFAAGKLWTVNARFTTAPTATTEYWITRLTGKMPTTPKV
jgi:hypothetical protein